MDMDSRTGPRPRGRLAGGSLVLCVAVCCAPGRADPAETEVFPKLDSPAIYSDAASALASRLRLNRHPDPALDGRFLLFGSVAVDMLPMPPASLGHPQVFVRDLLSGTTGLISAEAGPSAQAGRAVSTPVDISAEGRWVLFTSAATGLDGETVDDNSLQDVFLHDRATGSTRLVSRSAADPMRAANGGSQAVDLSADGRWILFTSTATDLVTGLVDANGVDDVFLYDRQTGEVRCVSRAAGGGSVGSGRSEAVALSDDGNWIVFHSTAPDLAGGIADPAPWSDVFVHERLSAQTQLVSRSASGGGPANFSSYAYAISADGGRVLFASGASDLVAGVSDGNQAEDVFYWTRSTGLVSLVSRRVGVAATATGRSLPGSISADGRWISFLSNVPALYLVGTHIDVNGGFDVYLHECEAGVNRLVSTGHTGAVTGNSWSAPIALSADGRHVLFRSVATDLLPGLVDDNGVEDVFVHDRVQGGTRLVSSSAQDPPGRSGNGPSTGGDLNAAGDRIGLLSQADDLQAGLVDANGEFDAFVGDGPGSAVVLASRRVVDPLLQRTASGRSEPLAVSEDGRWVLISTTAVDFDPDVEDRNGATDLFLRDRYTGAIVLVSRAAASALQTADAAAEFRAMSPDARWVLYRTRAEDVVPNASDTNGTFDTFLFDRESRSTVLVSHASGQPAVAANGEALGRAVSDDGSWVLYQTRATHVVPGIDDTNALDDVFLWHRQTRNAVLVSRAGQTASTGNAQSFSRGLSADGRWVALLSMATDLVPGVVDDNNRFDLFLFDRDSATLRLITRAAGSHRASNGSALYGSMTRDGRFIGFTHLSAASDLVPGVVQTQSLNLAFLYDREADALALMSHAAGDALRAANGSSTSGRMYPSADGRWWLHESVASDLAEGVVDLNGVEDVFLYDRISNASRLVSHAIDPLTSANGASSGRGLSADGQRLLFVSRATDLIEGVVDQNGGDDAYAVDRSSGMRTLLTRSRMQALQTANGASPFGGLSADGSAVVLWTDATDLVPAVIDLNQTLDAVSLSFPLPLRLFADGFEG